MTKMVMKMNELTKKELLSEIDICLQRKDISQKDFVYLNGLRIILNETKDLGTIVSFTLGITATILLFIMGYIAFG